MKYVISSGKSVISDIRSEGFVVNSDSQQGLKYDTFGDAMKECVKVNDLIGKSTFKVMPIE